MTLRERTKQGWYEQGARFAYVAGLGFSVSSKAVQEWIENEPDDFTLFPPKKEGA